MGIKSGSKRRMGWVGSGGAGGQPSVLGCVRALTPSSSGRASQAPQSPAMSASVREERRERDKACQLSLLSLLLNRGVSSPQSLSFLGKEGAAHSPWLFQRRRGGRNSMGTWAQRLPCQSRGAFREVALGALLREGRASCAADNPPGKPNLLARLGLRWSSNGSGQGDGMAVRARLPGVWSLEGSSGLPSARSGRLNVLLGWAARPSWLCPGEGCGRGRTLHSAHSSCG